MARSPWSFGGDVRVRCEKCLVELVESVPVVLRSYKQGVEPSQDIVQSGYHITSIGRDRRAENAIRGFGLNYFLKMSQSASNDMEGDMAF